MPWAPTFRGVHHLVGTAEIAELLGISRQRVHQLAMRDDFPPVVAALAAGSIWERAAIEAWAHRTGRLDDNQP